MEQFEYFLNGNLNSTDADRLVKGVREGVSNFYILNDLLSFPLDSILKARILYVRNLCLNDPILFDIPDQIQPAERALMLASMNLFEEAHMALQIDFSFNVIGTVAISHTTKHSNLAVLECLNTEDPEAIEFSYGGYTYPEFKAQRLNHLELISLFIKIKEITKNEDNEVLKKFKLNAYISRALWEENRSNEALRTAFLIFDSEINNSTDELAKLKDSNIQRFIDSEFFNSPIIFQFDILIQLGLAYKNRFFYKEAYECLMTYPLFLEKIDCLISLRKSEEAEREIWMLINMIGSSGDREDRMILCNLYIKLAHLYNDEAYFDKAAEVFRSSKPFYLKGLFHFKQKRFEKSADSLAQALEISPVCEKIRFSYACALIEIDKLIEAEKVLKELKRDDPMNENISKNLGYCYYRMNDIEKTLISLKSVAKSDPNSMSQFFILSVKNNKTENVKWAFLNMSSICLIESGVAHYSVNTTISISEIKELVKNNRYVDSEAFSEIFRHL